MGRPSYRGLLLWKDPTGGSVVVYAYKEKGKGALPSPGREPILVSDIRRIVQIEAPDWLTDANRSAAVMIAEGILRKSVEHDDG